MRFITILSVALLMLPMALCAQTSVLHNPVIGGFHPDPSVCRVGNDFYLVNSTFQYFPGVPIFHSQDLVNWRQIGNVLDREEQIPLGFGSSWTGIYAPTIREYEGTFYMITTNVGNGGNFMVTASNPEGPWSNPVWLKQGGIDPSLFFEDGKCYMVSNPDDSMMLCEIDPKTGKQLTESVCLWRGTGGRYPEGPHIYKKDGYYYLLISEGGTEACHNICIARSRDIYGPYEANPANPILTNCNRIGCQSQVQGTGHGDFVQAADGSWWIVFLAYRNYEGMYHHLGRETFLAPVEWDEGAWPVVNGGRAIEPIMQAKLLPEAKHQPLQNKMARSIIDHETLFIQNPLMDNYVVGRDMSIRLKAAGTLTGNQHPTFLGRRQSQPAVVYETDVKLNGGNASDARAGLSVYQIHDGHADIAVHNGVVRASLTLRSLCAALGEHKLPAGTSWVRLRVSSDAKKYYFSYSADNAGSFSDLGSVECSLLSTEVAGGFTGIIVGLFAEGGSGVSADFRNVIW